MEGIRLKRLKIDKYRNVAPGTELVFNDGFNVLLGKNGTGKTTLLRLIAMVVTGSFGHLKDEDFGLEYELAVSGFRIIATIRNESRRGRTATSSQMDKLLIGTSSPQSESTWSCEFKILSGEGSLAVTLCTVSTDPLRANLHFDGRDHPIAVQSPFEHNHLFLPLFSLIDIISSHANATNDTMPVAWALVIQRLFSTVSLLEVTMANGGRFDEALGALDVITADRSHNDAGDIRQAILWVLEGARPTKLTTGFNKFIPPQVREAVITSSPHSLADGILRFEHKSLRFLQKMVNVLGVNGVTLVASLDRKLTSEGLDAFIYNGFEFRVTLADDTIISHKHLSYGQKRLLSFLYYTACNPDIVIADELVNGLHYEWIGACLEEIEDRQSFLTSQNPVLLDLLPIESADDARRSFILCSNEVRDGRAQMVWKAMSEQSADQFYRAYETQALRVSEILRFNDLW